MNGEATVAAQDALEIVIARALAPTRWMLTAWSVLAAVYRRVHRMNDLPLVRHDFLAGYPASQSDPLLQAVRAWFEAI